MFYVLSCMSILYIIVIVMQLQGRKKNPYLINKVYCGTRSASSLSWRPQTPHKPTKVWTIIEKPDLTILELWRETLYTYDVIATILNIVDFQF